MKDKFYVYEWYNVDTKEVFYVGKGSGARYKDTTHRNKLFLDYIKHNNCKSKIVAYFSDEDRAFEYEKSLTDSYKEKNMCFCNLIDGGYGGYSSIWTDEMRNYMSNYNPMKSKEQRQRMIDNNPMKNKEIALKNGESKKRPVVINGIVYKGLIDAAKELNVAANTVLNWCKRGYDTAGNPCRYADEEQKEYKFKATFSKEVYVDDMLFPSLRAACDFLGVKDTSPLCKALKNNKNYKGHAVRYANQQPS